MTLYFNGGKHSWKRRKLWVTSIFTFCQNVFLTLFPKGCFNSDFVVKGQTLVVVVVDGFFISKIVFAWLLCFSSILTHYQTTNFRLFQTERVCRRQFQIWWKWQQVIQTGRKHCGKRRNCSLWATVFSLFFHSVFQRLVSQGRQKVSLCGNGLIFGEIHVHIC